MAAHAWYALALYGLYATLGGALGTASVINERASHGACGEDVDNRPTLALLQRGALSLTDPLREFGEAMPAAMLNEASKSSQQQDAKPPPERRGYMAHYNDSSCLIPEGSEANISTETDECLLGWNFTCSCQAGEKVIEAHRYLGGCSNQSIEHVRYFPVGRCLSAQKTDSNSDLYVKFDDFGTCPCCGAYQCKIWGDPHITVFDNGDKGGEGNQENAIALLNIDGAEESEDSFGTGDYWAIKSKLVFIQARYRKVYYPKAKIHDNSFLTGVAIGGPFLKGKTLLMGPRDTGKVELVNEAGEVEEILKYGGTYSDGELIEAHYQENAVMVKDESETAPGIYIHLPGGVKVEVNRFSQHIDLSITMAPDAAGPGGVDGQCGNFNGDASDDTAEMISERAGDQVTPEELLFRDNFTDTQVSEPPPKSDLASMAKTVTASAVHPLKIYLYSDSDCQMSANGSYVTLEAGKDLCELGWNFTCSCAMEKKVVVAQQHWPECGPVSYGPNGLIIKSVVMPNECHPPVSVNLGPVAQYIPFEISSKYWRLDASSCPCCEEPADCTLHGDPHITVFDQAHSRVLALLEADTEGVAIDDEEEDDSADFYGWGDFWLVKSEKVFIQARYRKVYYPKASEPLNHTYLTSVAVSGPFLQGHTFIIEPKIGSITWSHAESGTHQRILDAGEEDSAFEVGDGIKVRYHNRTALVPELKPVIAAVDLELPNDVKLFVDRFRKHLDLRISMVPSSGGDGGIDGQCGNFNGNPSDDSAELINDRIGYQVPDEDLLFEKSSPGMQA